MVSGELFLDALRAAEASESGEIRILWPEDVDEDGTEVVLEEDLELVGEEAFHEAPTRVVPLGEMRAILAAAAACEDEKVQTVRSRGKEDVKMQPLGPKGSTSTLVPRRRG